MNLDEAMAKIQEILAAEIQQGAVRGIDDLVQRRRQRAVLRDHMHEIEAQLESVRTQLRDLPKLPSWKVIQWAQAVQALPNLVFLELDTTGLKEDAQIIRVCVMSKDGQTLLDLYARPEQPLTAHISAITGIKDEQVWRNGQPIEVVLERLRQVLTGRYVLSYNQEFDLVKLQEATRRANVPDIVIIGDDLMKLAMSYFSLTQFPRLEDLCKRVEYPLPAQPDQTILHRAQGQIHLLDAMAKAITGPAASSSVPPDAQPGTIDFDPEHPF